MLTQSEANIAIVIPTYKAAAHINSVVKQFLPKCDTLIVVDDACPEHSTSKINKELFNEIKIVRNEINLGVGGAMKTGFREALRLNADIVVKVDADGQMDPRLFDSLIDPLKKNKVDFVKGNRFFSISKLKGMPIIRLVGNSGLSFVSKAVSGYWGIMDPTNGYFAISSNCLKSINFDSLDNRYFFESDLISLLGLNRMRLREIPMNSVYGDEVSNLSIAKVLLTFPPKFAKRFFKRLFYNYFLRDINPGSISLMLGIWLSFFGMVFGSLKWAKSIQEEVPVTSGTVMLAALPIILGAQFLIYFLQYDIEQGAKLTIGSNDI